MVGESDHKVFEIVPFVFELLVHVAVYVRQSDSVVEHPHDFSKWMIFLDFITGRLQLRVESHQFLEPKLIFAADVHLCVLFKTNPLADIVGEGLDVLPVVLVLLVDSAFQTLLEVPAGLDPDYLRGLLESLDLARCILLHCSFCTLNNGWIVLVNVAD